MRLGLRARTSAAALAAAAAVAPFLPALRAGFLEWDDQATVVANAAHLGFSPSRLWWMLSARSYGPWQPLSWLSYAVDFSLWGLDAPAFRLTNLLLHGLAAALAVSVARRLLEEEFSSRVPPRALALGALAAGLFFALHPLRVESVVWITERRDVLSGVLLLAAWRARQKGRGRAALGLFSGALLAKGTAVALPFFLLAAERPPLTRRVLRGLAPYFALAAAAAAMNLVLLGRGDLQAPWIGALARLAVAGHSAGFYLAKTLWPFGLSPYYPLPQNWLAAAPRLAAYASLAAAATGATWLWRRRAPWALPAWLAYLSALIPVSGLFQNGAQLAADRYSYLPCLPFAFVGGGLAAALAARRPRAAAALVAAGALALAASTWRQSGFWRDDVSLWTRAAALAPDAYLPRSNLAAALFAAGDAEGALAQYPEVLRLEPRDAEARVNLGVLLQQRGRSREAESLFREALRLRPGDLQATTNLGGLLARRGEREAAISLLRPLAAANPDFAPARFNLGLLLLSSGRKEDGLAHLREAVRLDPSLARRLRAPR